MDVRELVTNLAQHPLVKSDMPLQVQLGLPYLELKGGKLCISFRPHRELCVDGKIEIYPHQYEITWVYPFEKVVRFTNLAYEREIEVSEPVAQIGLKWMSGAGRYVLEELYHECTRVISAWQQDGRVSKVMLERYQRLYFETARMLQLEKLYGEAK